MLYLKIEHVYLCITSIKKQKKTVKWLSPQRLCIRLINDYISALIKYVF